jgi:hypothetical protein
VARARARLQAGQADLTTNLITRSTSGRSGSGSGQASQRRARARLGLGLGSCTTTQQGQGEVRPGQPGRVRVEGQGCG